MIKVLVVDDSALMRKHLVTLLESEGGFQIRVARNGAEALSLLGSFDPDVITLDINMPEMDGITCLSRIMVEKPKPVLMVSSLTEKGAEATLQALSLGAVDYVHKPDGTISLSIERIQRELLVKVKGAARARVRRSAGPADTFGRASRFPKRDRREQGSCCLPAADPAGMGLVLIGVSTGGPGTLEEIPTFAAAGFPLGGSGRPAHARELHQRVRQAHGQHLRDPSSGSLQSDAYRTGKNLHSKGRRRPNRLRPRRKADRKPRPLQPAALVAPERNPAGHERHGDDGRQKAHRSAFNRHGR